MNEANLSSVDDITLFKSRTLPYINYFQYPPLQIASALDQNEIGGRICLHDECPDPEWGNRQMKSKKDVRYGSK